MAELILIPAAVVAAAFGVQMLILRLTQKKWKPLRWLVLSALIPLGLLVWDEVRIPSMFGGLDDLAALFYLLLAICVLVGWIMGWAVHALVGRRPHKGE